MEYIQRDDHMAITAVENVLVVAWLGSPGIPSADALERATRLVRSRHPNGMAHLNLVTKTSSPMTFDDAARKTIVGLLHDESLHLHASVTIYEGGGFVAATIRGVLASLTMLARTPVKIRFVATLEEAEPFLRKTLGAMKSPMPPASALLEAAARVKSDAQAAGFQF